MNEKGKIVLDRKNIFKIKRTKLWTVSCFYFSSVCTIFNALQIKKKIEDYTVSIYWT